MAYNLGTAAEVLENVYQVIEGGKAVEAAKVSELVADNGAKIFDIATKEVFAANGSATEVAEVVSIAEGATAGTTAGAGIFTMEATTAATMVAPVLGIAAGFGLYNLAPDFWTDVADKLVDAGVTVKNKVVGLLMPDGSTTLPKSVINVFKEAFLNAGLFNPIVEFENYTYCPEGVQLPLFKYRGSTIYYLQTNSVTTSAGKYFIYHSLSLGRWYLTGMLQNNVDMGFLNNPPNGGSGLNTTTYTYNGNDYYIIAGNYFERSIEYYEWLLPVIESNPSPVDFVKSLIQHDPNFIDWNVTNPNLQPDAVLPQPNIDITITYPDWLPWEFPQSLPVELPDVFPVSIPTPDITQTPAQTGDNPLPEQLDKIIEILFNPLPEPDPGITPDPDPGITPEPEPQPDPDPEPNPPDPNPPVPTPPGTIPIPTLTTTSADRMFTVYKPTDANVDSLGAFLWTNNVIEQIKKLWDDPMQAIISFHKIYGAPSTGSSKNIILGYIDSGVSAPVVTSQFCEVDCGSVTVPELLNNATSYSPFTSLHIYLPFVGIMELDTNECMGATLQVKYRIDVYTGTCIALIYATRNPDLANAQILYTFSGNASQQLPLTSSSFGGAITALLGLAGAGVAVASGGALGVAAGALGAAHSLTQEMVHINRSGGLSANAGILAPRTPYLILSRQYGYDANGYAGFYGYPSNKTVYIGNCNGYIKCKDVIFRGSCTQAEVEEIERLLKNGVYV